MKVNKQMMFKLDEAENYYNEMIANKNDLAKFIFSLSAFVNASRSVLQYPYEYLKDGKLFGTPEGIWFDEFRADPKRKNIFAFFKDERDFNIHRGPVKTTITGIINLRMTFKVKKDGTLEPVDDESDMKSTISAHTYWFDNWHGDEDVLALCRRYLNELNELHKDGVKKGFIVD